MRIGERAQENCVDEAEDGGVCSYSDGERKYHDCSEARAPAQLTQTITHILPENLDSPRAVFRQIGFVSRRHSLLVTACSPA